MRYNYFQFYRFQAEIIYWRLVANNSSQNCPNPLYLDQILMSIELSNLNPSLEEQQPNPTACANVDRLLKTGPQQILSTKTSSFSLDLIYFSPESRFAICYNTLYLIAFYFLQVHVTLTMTFGLYFLSSDLSNDLFSVYYWVIVGFYIIDMALTFVKGYYHKGKGIIIDDVEKIIKRYLKFQFWIDLANVGFLMIPYLSKSSNSELAFFVPLFLTWIKKFQIQQQLIHYIQYHKKFLIFVKIFIISCDLLLIDHYGACIFLKIDLILQGDHVFANQDMYWYNENDPYGFTQFNDHWYIYYLFAQGFSTGTMTALVPGPYAKNPISITFAIFVSPFFIILATYVADTLIDILQPNSDKKNFHQESIETVSKFMREKKVTLKLKVLVIDYFETIWQFRSKFSKDEEQKVILMLPDNLQRDLILELSFVRKIYLFKTFKNPQILLYELSKKIKRTFINENTLFFFDSERESNPGQAPTLECNAINFLATGMVEFFVECYGTRNNNIYHIALSNVNKFIGFYEFFTKQALFYNCKTLDLCEFNTIERADFDEAIKLSKNRELLHQITNELVVYNRNHLVHRICMVCDEQDHIESSCPQIFVSKTYEQSALSKIKNGTQERNESFKRNNLITSQLSANNTKISTHTNTRQSLNNRTSLTLNNLMMNRMIIPTLKKIGIPSKIARSEDFERCKMWKQYYPEFNLVKGKGNG